MKSTVVAIVLATGIVAAPLDGRASYPDIHIFGARETTAVAGYGSSITMIDDILNGYSGSTAEAIDYLAGGDEAFCGGDSYSESVAAGVPAVVTAVNNYAAECPSTQLVLVGYSQIFGSEIFDVALCGGGDPNQGITNTAVLFSITTINNIKAIIFMGNPMYYYSLLYDVGICIDEQRRIYTFS
ncbi:alpha/beta-hydrolase [Acephala macrosclerotiorum]|nr:alpha/beta-hydrolase [Acephala macrosclerotiorum]